MMSAVAGPEETATTSHTRLHITPLNPELLNVVLPSAVLPRARNVSYHILESFPEKSYGFLELPVEDAARIKRKLNGAVLRGVKIRVEKARPDMIPVPLGKAEAMAGEKAAKKEKRSKDKDKSKKRKRESQEITGVELEAGRKVKRGWTTAPDETTTKQDREKRDKNKKEKKKGKKEIKSRYTDHAECLVKTTLPDHSEDKEEDESGKKRKKSKRKDVVIHEFEKTTKFPTFLKSTDSSSSKRKPELEFVDGKGWVDEDGNVVEPVKPRPGTVSMEPIIPSSSTNLKSSQAGSMKRKGESPKSVSSSDSDDSASSESEDEHDIRSEEEAGTEDGNDPMDVDNTPPPSNPSHLGRIDNSSNSSFAKPASTPVSTQKAEPPRPMSSSSVGSLTIKIPPTTPTVHPLEALYKRVRPADGEAPGQAESAEPFSFFGAGDIPDDAEAKGDASPAPTSQPPMTPFTRLDFESRNVRSAAPTPDTAHPTRSSRLWSRGDDDDIEEESEDGEDSDDGCSDSGEGSDQNRHGRAASPGDAEGPGYPQPNSDFQKWFWENRGDLSRAWKRRRKAVAKEKRYRDNKARAEKAI